MERYLKYWKCENILNIPKGRNNENVKIHWICTEKLEFQQCQNIRNTPCDPPLEHAMNKWQKREPSRTPTQNKNGNETKTTWYFNKISSVRCRPGLGDLIPGWAQPVQPEFLPGNRLGGGSGAPAYSHLCGHQISGTLQCPTLMWGTSAA